LPVPLSPVTSTVVSAAAARPISLKRSFIARLRPTIGISGETAGKASAGEVGKISSNSFLSAGTSTGFCK
jgi:hypothetical protein